jgi:hypothetical protein
MLSPRLGPRLRCRLGTRLGWARQDKIRVSMVKPGRVSLVP